MQSNWRRYHGGKQISTGRGERIRKWFHRRRSHTFGFGVTFRAVTYADHRSGWSGVKVDIALGWWNFSLSILAWKNGPRPNFITITLAEQLRRTHSQGPSLEEQEEREAAEKADKRAQVALFDKQLEEWDERHKPPLSDEPR